MNPWFNILPEAILSVAATLLLIVSTLASTPAMRDLLRWLSVFAVAASGIALVYVSGAFGLSPDGWLNGTQFTTSVSLVLLTLIGWAILASPVRRNRPVSGMRCCCSLVLDPRFLRA